MVHSEKRDASQLTQKFFWGTHAGIGRVKYRELNAGDTAQRFLVGEMQRRGCGLVFDDANVPPFPEVDEEVTVANNAGSSDMMRFVGGKRYREVASIQDLHWTVIRRFQSIDRYRPTALAHLEEELTSASWKNLRDEEIRGGV